MSANRLRTTTLRDLALISFVAVLVMFTNLGGPRLWDRDEPRNAGCAHEMLLRGDWITPVFNAELRAHKPVLLYWLIMSAYTVLGVSEFSARFWSAMLAVGTVLCTYALGRRLFRRQTGVWAAIILATALLFAIAGRAATPDSALIFFSTLALTIFVRATFPPEAGTGYFRIDARGIQGDDVRRSFVSGGSGLGWTTVYASMALGVLAKGPVGFVLPAAVIGLFLLIDRRPALKRPADSSPLGRLQSARACLHPRHAGPVVWSMRPVTALIVVAVIALPWYVAVGLRTDGQFLREFLGSHHFGRATAAMEGHDGSFLFYPVAILIGFFPWSVFAVPVLIDTVKRWRAEPATAGYLFLVCWILVYVGFFSLARTKLPSYVTPTYPAIALLTGCFVDGWASGRSRVPRYWPQLSLGVFALVGLVMVIALPLAARQVLPGEEWLAIIGGIPLVFGLAALALTFERRTGSAVMMRGPLKPSPQALFAGGAAAFVSLVMAVGTQRVDAHQRNVEILLAVKQYLGNVPLASYGCLEPSWVVYTGQPIEELAMDERAITSSAWVEVADDWIPKPAVTVRRLLERQPSPAIVTSDEHLETLRAALPPDFRVVAECPYFLRDRQLLILARRDRLEAGNRTQEAQSRALEAGLRTARGVR